MLMVVFGAGASYDSIPSHPPTRYPPLLDRLPLANELFDDRPKFIEEMTRFHECQPIIPYLQKLPRDRSIERVLEGLQAEAEDYPVRLQQLTAIRFYLRNMIWNCQLRWNQIAAGITNYKTLLDEIDRWRPYFKQVCLVTFNYDTMLEAALEQRLGIMFRGLPDYIARDDYKLIKLHGSVNWGREIDPPFADVQGRDHHQLAHEIIDRITALSPSQQYQIIEPLSVRDPAGQRVFFPAIAIPVESKREYECPEDHVTALRGCIPKVTKLMVVGWRATEQPFLELLHDLPQRIPVMAVAGTESGAREVQERLNAAFVGGRFATHNHGFTQFVVNRVASGFLSSVR